MRRLPLLLGALFLISTSFAGQDWVVPPEHHSWARFPQGSWKEVRVRTESYDANGDVVDVSSAVTRTTMGNLSRRGFSLHVETTVEYQGARFPTQDQWVDEEFEAVEAREKEISEATLSIGGRLIPCSVRRLEIDDRESRRISTMHVAREPSEDQPIVLKRRTISQRRSNNEILYRTEVEVVDVGSERDVIGDLLETWTVRTIHEMGSRSTTTWEVHCAEVPGGVISRETEERVNGQLVRSTRLELLGYGFDGPVPRRRILRGRR